MRHEKICVNEGCVFGCWIISIGDYPAAVRREIILQRRLLLWLIAVEMVRVFGQYCRATFVRRRV